MNRPVAVQNVKGIPLDNTDLISSDDIENNNLNWCMVDQIAKELKPYNIFILNTDVSTGDGIHWVACIALSDSVYVIDPLGPQNKRKYDDMMLKICKDNGYDVNFYPYKFQLKTSAQCGYFAIYVCKKVLEPLLNKYGEDITIEKINKKIVSIFGKTADTNDLMVLIKAFGLQKKNNF